MRIDQREHESQVFGESRLWTREAWNVVQSGAEMLRGFSVLQRVGPCVTVFGSARFPEDHKYYGLAREVGEQLANSGFATMTGGGPGIMEAANRGAREAGGLSIGCNIRLPEEQRTNPYLDHFITLDRFFVRKVLLINYSHGFVVLPGGYGTMDELFEVLTLMQTGKLDNFPVVLLPSEFWSPLFAQIETSLLGNGTIGGADLEYLKVMDSPAEAVDFIHRRALNPSGQPWKTASPLGVLLPKS